MQTLAALLLSFLTLITLIAAFLMLRGFFPLRVDKVRAALESSWRRSFWLGLVNTLFTAALLLGFFALGDAVWPFFVPAFALSGLYLVVLLFGLTALAQLLGSRLFPERKPVPREIRGGVILLLASLTPVLGWFLLLPYFCFLAVGAVVLRVFGRKQAGEQREEGG